MPWEELVALLPASVASLQPTHALVEALLVLALLYLLLKRPSRPSHAPLTPAEEDALLEEWQPEPLVVQIRAQRRDLCVLEGAASARVHVRSVGEAVNAATLGVLGYQADDRILEAALRCTERFGVGACGPRGFYGSIAPHMDLEQRMAAFLGAPDGVMFSSEYQVAASLLPALAKAGDYIILDSGVGWAIQQGALLSRSDVRWFQHYQLDDLARTLESLSGVFTAQLRRVFVVLETVCSQHGEIAPLPAILELKKRYPFRLLLDESCSIGVLGKTGRGALEHFAMPDADVEVRMASLGTALGSTGGIAVGSRIACDHMRLNCTGYVFSCSSPPYLAAAAVEALSLLEQGVELAALRSNVDFFRARYGKGPLSKLLITVSAAQNPQISLFLADALRKGRDEDEALLEDIASSCLRPAAGDPLLLAVVRTSHLERHRPPPSLRFTVSALHSREDLSGALEVLECAAQAVIARRGE